MKAPSFTTQILDITNSNTVTTTNITFDGNEIISNGALIEMHDSILNLNEGTTVQKNNNRGKYYEDWHATGAMGGGLYLLNSNLNINGADIINNKTSAQNGSWSHGAGMYAAHSTLNFNNGSISYNENVGSISNQAGGGVELFNGTFNMRGGTISYNKANQNGGGVFINSDSKDTTMIMTGGTISNNSAGVGGGGISSWVETGSTSKTIVYIKGGTILNNTAPKGPNFLTGNGGQIIDQR